MSDTTPLLEITGFEELQRKLQALGNDRQKRTEILRVLRKVAQGTVKAARRRAPISKAPHKVSGKRTAKTIQPGALRKSIGVITGRRAENPTVYVGPRAKGNFDGWYGHFVEYGHNIYKSGFKRKRSASAKAKLSNNAGAAKRTDADPFMAETYAQTKGQATAETVKSVEKVIQKSIDRLSR